jgi:predicted ABC-type ATPase
MTIEQFVNADLIAQGLSPLAPQSAELEAGKLMLARIRELAGRGDSFAFETTLASRTFRPFLLEQQTRGYTIHLVYLWLRRPELAIARVAERVRCGGHHVPDEVVRRRYQRGLRNLFQLYLPLANSWLMCDNSTGELQLVAEGGLREQTLIHDRELFSIIQRYAGA